MKEKKMVEDEVFYVILILIVLFLMYLLMFNVINDYNSFRNNKDYFSSENAKIEAWMTPLTVLNHFNISEKTLFEQLNMTQANANLRISLQQICLRQHIDCIKLVDKLNSLT